MKRLLTLAATVVFLVSCGGPVETPTPTEEGTTQTQTALNPIPGGLEPVDIIPPWDVIEMPELVLEAPVIQHDIEALMAPPVEERFFFVIPISLEEEPKLPPPACPMCAP
ncbi:MAG: hypothetical protein AB1938_14040 [Myxococcota bacterium]